MNYSSFHQGSDAILFLSHSLERGGAQRQLVVLAKDFVRRGKNVCVAVFYGGGVYEAELIDAGVRVIDLHKRGRWEILPFLYRLARLLRRERPLVLHSYLGTPNILAVLFKPLLPNTRIIWGVRASNMDFSRYDWLLRLSSWLECRLSRYADLIIANSYAGQDYAIRQGFPKERIRVIANGIDTARFRFVPAGREKLRGEWQVEGHELVVGLVARLDPMKGHGVFLRAAAMVARNHPTARFVCIGDGPAAYREEMHALAEALGLSDRMIWMGARDDMEAVYSALDIACSSSSFGEGFSNVIAEAMSCERPCVVTDVGDSRLIVGKAGTVVPSGDPQHLARGLANLIDLSPAQRGTLGKTARNRIEMEFSVEILSSRTEQVLGFSPCA